MLSAMLSAHDVDALELVIHLEHALLAAGLGKEPHHHGGVVHLPNHGIHHHHHHHYQDDHSPDQCRARHQVTCHREYVLGKLPPGEVNISVQYISDMKMPFSLQLLNLKAISASLNSSSQLTWRGGPAPSTSAGSGSPPWARRRARRRKRRPR